MSQKITFAISPEGKIIADYDGFVGTMCFEESAKLIEHTGKLGVDTEKQEVKAKESVGKVAIHEKVKH